MSKKLERPKMKKFDSVDDFIGGTESGLTMLTPDTLRAFEKHPFTLYNDERLDDLMTSIKEHGVIMPIIVRKQDEGYEILSGHNRVEAAKKAGLSEIPSVIVEADDDKAMAYVIETNLMQRSFSDMSHSEKTSVIALHHSKLFSPGKRNDIKREIARLSGEREEGIEEEIAPHRSNESLAEEYGLSPANVSRYLRLRHLEKSLMEMLDGATLPFRCAVELSFLPWDVQKAIAECCTNNNFKVSLKQGDVLRNTYKQNNSLSGEAIYKILAGISDEPKPVKVPKVKIRSYDTYFTEEQSTEEVEEIIEEALQLYFAQKDSE